MADKKKYILNQSTAEKKLRRMALEIIEKNPDEKQIILAGIRGGGTVVAQSIQQCLSEFASVKTELIDILLDKNKPKEIIMSKKIDFNDKIVIVIDDVSNSGKTLLYALKPFLDYHPKKIQ